MAELKAYKPAVTLTATFTLDEQEIAALDALAGYGVDAFLGVFYEKLGEAYLKPHEVGLRRLLEGVRKTAGPALKAAADARKILAASAGEAS